MNSPTNDIENYLTNDDDDDDERVRVSVVTLKFMYVGMYHLSLFILETINVITMILGCSNNSATILIWYAKGKARKAKKGSQQLSLLTCRAKLF